MVAYGAMVAAPNLGSNENVVAALEIVSQLHITINHGTGTNDSVRPDARRAGLGMVLQAQDDTGFHMRVLSNFKKRQGCIIVVYDDLWYVSQNRRARQNPVMKQKWVRCVPKGSRDFVFAFLRPGVNLPKAMIQAAAETFSINVKKGSQGRTLLQLTAAEVFSPLKSSIILLQEGEMLIAILTSHFLTHYYRPSNIIRRRVAMVLDLPVEQVVCFSSHNHCVVKLNHNQYSLGQPEPDLVLPESELTWEGTELLNGYVEAAKRLVTRMVDVTIRYGAGTERRITHNRKGRRADGSTYLMREEDRLLLGEDFSGDIDDDAFVVGFYDQSSKPVAFLTHFTGHPVTAFHCDSPIVHGEFPQVACDDLSAAHGDVPVGFLQGCAGDTNSKGLLSKLTSEENVRRAETYGHQLGDTFQKIANNMETSERNDLFLQWIEVALPFRGVPAQSDLEKTLTEAEGFLARCAKGNDLETRECDSLNFPSNMSIPYRQRLIGLLREWLKWALSFHYENRLHEAPISTALRVLILRVGDVGIAGMPCEPLMGIGRQIKRGATTRLTLPCGYMHDTSIGYVPDSSNCNDRDFVSAFYRYTQTLLPYQHPAGDLLASAIVQKLNQSLEASGTVS